MDTLSAPLPIPVSTTFGFDSTDMGEQQGMAEIVAYGTAVTLAD